MSNPSNQQSQPQSFILEPILTPSGIFDGGSDDQVEVDSDGDFDLVEVEVAELTEAESGWPDVVDDDLEYTAVSFFDAIEAEYSSGVFTVEDSGRVEVDFLFDGGYYQGEVGLFSLEGIDAEPGSREFIQEAARRALSGSDEGHVVISDRAEGAKFTGTLPEGNFNQGEYSGPVTVEMQAGDRFGIMLVADHTIAEVHEGKDWGVMFSMVTENSDDGLQFGQMVDVTGEGNTFVFEDLDVDGHSDRDYNDIVLSIRGADVDDVPLMDDLLSESGDDWRETEVGQELIDYVTSYEVEEVETVVTYSDRFLNPNENFELIGRVDDVEAVENVEIWVRDRSTDDWQSVSVVNTFDEDGSFSVEHQILEPGHYEYKTITHYESGLTESSEVQDMTVLSLPEGEELSDRVKLALERATNLNSYTPDELNSAQEWVIGVRPGQDVDALAEDLGLKNLGWMDSLPNSYRWEVPEGFELESFLAAVEDIADIEYFHPITSLQLDLHSPTQEPYVNSSPNELHHQWHLQSDNLSGVQQAWQANQGENTLIGIIDDGFLLTHRDLTDPTRYHGLSKSFAKHDADDSPDPYLEPISVAYTSPAVGGRAIGEQGNDYFELPVPLTGNINSLELKLNIRHENINNLSLNLYSPSGTVYPITDSLLSDLEKTIEIAQFNDKNAKGRWLLEIQKINSDSSTGTLENFELIIETYNTHGTQVAGIAIADGNNGELGSGVAPGAEWAALSINLGDTTEAALQNVLKHGRDEVDVYNNSWGVGFFQSDQEVTSSEQIFDTVEKGRDGKGNIYVFSAGNSAQRGGNVNYNPYTNSRHTIAVGAVDQSGESPDYSTPGASVLVSAYTGLQTTAYDPNRPDQYTEFQRTSASAPFISGVIALMLSENPDLTWRDVQHILVDTAQKVGSRPEQWQVNGAGHDISYEYGFGLVDAAAAVQEAQPETWQSPSYVPSFKASDVVDKQKFGWGKIHDSVPETIGDSDPYEIRAGQNNAFSPYGSFRSGKVGENIKVELEIAHDRSQDLVAKLVHKKDNVTTEVVLFENVTFPVGGGVLTFADEGGAIAPPGSSLEFGQTYRLPQSLDNRFDGLDRNGTWEIVIEDQGSGQSGQLQGWTLETSPAIFQKSIEIPDTQEMLLDWVELEFRGSHEYKGNIDLTLVHEYTNAQGDPVVTESVLAKAHSYPYEEDPEYAWFFTTARHWGEPAHGTWTLKVADTVDGSDGYLDNWDLHFHGSDLRNRAPKATTLTQAHDYREDESLQLTPIVVTDADGDTVSVVLSLSDAAAGTLTGGGVSSNAQGVWEFSGTPQAVTTALENLQFVPADDFNGDLTIRTEVTDGNIASPLVGLIDLNGIAVNDAPDVQAGQLPKAGTVGEPLAISYADLVVATGATDVEGDEISFTISSVASGSINNLPITVVPGEAFVWTPDTEGSVAAFEVVATDGVDDAAPVMVSAVVNAAPTPVNTAPTVNATATPFTGAVESQPYTISYADLVVATGATDAEGDEIQFEIPSVASGVLLLNGVAVEPGTTVMEPGDELVWTPNAVGDGQVGFVVRATDGAEVSDVLDITFDVAQDVPSNQFPAQFNLSDLDGSNGFVINGIDAYDQSGWSVSNAGDVNDDGIDDLLIGGSYGADPNDKGSAGETYVVFGSEEVGSTGSLELTDLDGNNGFVIKGINLGDKAGDSVSNAGDVNDDGIDDLLIGAGSADPDGNQSAGETYVVFGSEEVGSTGSLELADLDGNNGFVIKGIDSVDVSGQSVSNAGDVNSDGIDDLLIGAYGAEPNGKAIAGETYVVFGSEEVGNTGSLALADLNGNNGFVINGVDAYDHSGISVSNVGDVNADGIDDLLIGAYGAEPNGNYDAGKTYVVFGSEEVGSTGSLELTDLNGNNGFVINGIDFTDYSGYSVSNAGDVNADGIDDLLISAHGADYGTGETYVVFGSEEVGSTGSLELTDLNGSNGFVISGVDSGDSSGRPVSNAGDVNADGIDDLLIGAFGGDPHGEESAGETYVVFGSQEVGSTGRLKLADLNGDNGFVISGIDRSDHSGWSVSNAGDVNADGIDDLLIGAYGGDPHSNNRAGETYVVFGRNFANDAPTLNTINPFTNATQNQPYTLTHADLLAASDVTDPDPNTTISFQIATIDDGTLKVNGSPANPDDEIQPGDTVEWTPNTAGDGVTGFTVKASDGELVSDAIVPVKFDVATADPGTGQEFWIGHYSENLQDRSFEGFSAMHNRSSNVTALSNGNFVVTWASENKTDTGFYDVYVQQYNAEGGTVGSQRVVNTQQSNDQWLPTVTPLPDDEFFVSWGSNAGDGSTFDIYGQRFNSDSTPDGGEFQINTTTAKSQNHQQVTTLSDGTLMITWNSDGQDGSGQTVVGRRMSSTGQFLSDEFVLNSNTAGNQARPDITATSDGGFIVTWSGDTASDPTDNIFARRFAGFDENQQPQPLGPEFPVRIDGQRGDVVPQIATLENGNFVVTWWSNVNGDSKVFGQLYDASGQTMGEAFQLNTNAPGYEFEPVVVMLEDGSFLTAWSSFNNGIRAQRFDGYGDPMGGEFTVSDPGFYERWPQLARLADGKVAVTWQREIPAAVSTTSDQIEVYGKLLEFDAVNVAPRLSEIEPFTGAKENEPYALTYTQLLAASDVQDANGSEVSFKVETLNSGTLKINGSSANPDDLIKPGDELEWTPSTTGDAITGFTVKASDGQLLSENAVETKFNVEAINPPTTSYFSVGNYTSINNASAGGGALSQIEDFQDNAINALGILNTSSTTIVPGGIVNETDLSNGPLALQITGNTFTVEFDSRVIVPTSAGLAFINHDADSQASVAAFDSQGRKLKEVDVPNPSQSSNPFVAFLGNAGIASIQVTTDDPDGWLVDHIRYG